MGVLFVCSGNNGISPIVRAQADSLLDAGLIVDIFTITGKGVFGYIKSIPRLQKYIRDTDPQIVHAHYSFCGFVAALSSHKPVVTSLMGSDVKKTGYWRFIIKFFIRYSWKFTIVKSLDMKMSLRRKEIVVLPNGVDLDMFKPMDRVECRKLLDWGIEHMIILFAADPDRPEKNFALAKTAIEKCKDPNIELKVVYNVAHTSMPQYLNASDVLLLTSNWEGSPNIVKEAMACNVPVVSSKVGDVQWLFGNTEGYLIAKQNAEDMKNKLIECLGITTCIPGRDRIHSLGLGSAEIAQKLVKMYREAYNSGVC